MTSVRFTRFMAALTTIVILATALSNGALAVAPGNEHFQRTWERADQPVLAGNVARTWMWGPEAFTEMMTEPYLESPNGSRQVQYHDKARMEITDPSADSSSLWYVTNGLLVVELITGQMQVGDDDFKQRSPAAVIVAGDADDPSGPTYATFGSLLDAPPRPNGTTISERVDREANVTNDPALAGQGVRVGFIDEVTNHAIAGPFWEFMNSTGTVYENSQYVTEPLFENAFFATGRPITEAYWANVKVGGQYRDVLMQCFERRCLTYTPGNPDGFIVEAGNVGQHYYSWRYGDAGEDENGGGTPVPPPPPSEDPDDDVPVADNPPATHYEFFSKWGLPAQRIEFDALTRTAVAPGGEVYVTGPGSEQVLKFSPEGTLITSWGSPGTSTGQFRGAVGVAVDSRGDVYIADRDNNRIQKFDANGAFIMASQTGVTGSGALGSFIQPWDIAVGPDDTIYVTEIGNRRVQKFTRNLEYQGVIGYTDDGLGGAGEGQFIIPGGIAVSDSGLVFVSDLELDRVQVFDSDQKLVGAFGSSGDEDGELGGPYGLDILPNGDVYVTENGNDRIQIFTPDKVIAPDPNTPATAVAYRHFGYLGKFGEFFYEQFDNPNDIAFYESSTAYVLDAGNNMIKVFESHTANTGLSEFVRVDQWLDTTRENFSFGNPESVSIAPDGRVVAIDDRQGKIKTFTPTGEFVDETFTFGPITSHRLADLAFDHNGFFYVTDSKAGRVYQLDLDDIDHFAEFGQIGSGDGEFNNPNGIAVDGHGNIYVVDAGNDRIQKFAPDFSFITAWGERGDGDGQFTNPRDIAISGSYLYVTEGSLNERVQVFDLDGNFIASWSDFDGPNGIAVDAEGFVYVSDGSAQSGAGHEVIQKFTPDGDLLASFGTVGSGDGQIHINDGAPGIAIDADGNVYVADYGNQRIQVFAPQS